MMKKEYSVVKKFSTKVMFVVLAVSVLLSNNVGVIRSVAEERYTSPEYYEAEKLLCEATGNSDKKFIILALGKEVNQDKIESEYVTPAYRESVKKDLLKAEALDKDYFCRIKAFRNAHLDLYKRVFVGFALMGF